MAEPYRPYQGKELSRKERRAIRKRAQRRAAAMAKGMPAPEKSSRVDPVTGRPMYEPGHGPGFSALPAGIATTGTATGATPAAGGGLPGGGLVPPAVPVQPAGTPVPAPVPAPDTSRQQLPPTPVIPAPEWVRASAPQRRHPVTGPATTRRGPGALVAGLPALLGRLRRKQDSAPTTQLPSLNQAFARAATPGVRDRLLAPVAPGSARWLFSSGAAGVALGVMILVGLGLPTLGHGWDPAYAGTGVLAVALGGYLAFTGWANTPARPRLVVTAAATLLAVAFCVGVASNPVVVNGRVLLSTSKEARSVRLADEIYTDLRRSAQLDDLLTASIEDARANVSRYDPATRELVSMSAKYANMSTSDLPDPSFATVVESMKTSAYWGAKAMDTKASLIEQENARAESDLETQRATFADNWFKTGTALKEVTDALGVPFSTKMEGPHE